MYLFGLECSKNNILSLELANRSRCSLLPQLVNLLSRIMLTSGLFRPFLASGLLFSACYFWSKFWGIAFIVDIDTIHNAFSSFWCLCVNVVKSSWCWLLIKCLNIKWWISRLSKNGNETLLINTLLWPLKVAVIIRSANIGICVTTDSNSSGATYSITLHTFWKQWLWQETLILILLHWQYARRSFLYNSVVCLFLIRVLQPFQQWSITCGTVTCSFRNLCLTISHWMRYLCIIVFICISTSYLYIVLYL